MDTRVFYPGVKRRGREADHLSPSGAEVTITWSYSFTPPYISIAWCRVTNRGSFINFSAVFV